ncbi:hypothetical protein U1Q18_036793 [Sarracenia purpurea var. burkii]
MIFKIAFLRIKNTVVDSLTTYHESTIPEKSPELEIRGRDGDDRRSGNRRLARDTASGGRRYFFGLLIGDRCGLEDAGGTGRSCRRGIFGEDEPHLWRPRAGASRCVSGDFGAGKKNLGKFLGVAALHSVFGIA